MKNYYENKKLENGQIVMNYLEEFERTGSKLYLQAVLTNLIYEEFNDEIFDTVYFFDNRPLKNVVIKKAPKSWLKNALLTEQETDYVGAMLNRIQEEKLKLDANELIHARHWEVRLYAAQFASTEELLAQLPWEENQAVILEILRRL